MLRFPLIPFVDRVRMGMVIGYLRYHPAQAVARVRQDRWPTHGCAQWMGQHGLRGGVGIPAAGQVRRRTTSEVNLAWFWARVYARTPKLAYFDGGFQAFVDHLAGRVRSRARSIRTGAAVEAIRPRAGRRL